MTDQAKIQELIRQMQALAQSGREQVLMLRPAWGAHLAGETLKRLEGVIDALERELAPAGGLGETAASRRRLETHS